MALKVPNSPATNTIVYNDLKGVDFSQDASLIDRRHSPDMLNMISDEGGNPVKRKGWEVLKTIEDFNHGNDNRINNLWAYSMDGTDYLLVETHYENDQGYLNYYLYLVTLASDGTVSSVTYKDWDHYPKSCAFYYKTSDKEYFYLFDTYGVRAIDSNGYLTYYLDTYEPTIVISRPPNGEGGTPYEEINLLSGFVKEKFIVTGSSASTFVLSQEAKTYHVIYDDYHIKIQTLQADGTWQDYEGTITVGADKKTITVYPAIPVTPSTGTDNVIIRYKCRESSYQSIAKCTNSALFAQGTTDHVFLTGSPDDPQKVWYSAIGDPTYFPDTNYLYFGSSEGECMGFLPIQNQLAVVKSEQNNNHTSLYLIYDTSITSSSVETTNAQTGETTTKTEQIYTFAVKRVATSVGAISKNGFGVLGDEPLFLSSQGLYGITSLNTTEDKAVTNRSRSIDRKLTAEDLSEAQVITHNNYLYVFVNNHVYVFDGRQKTADRKNNTPYFYEAYYWDNVPAKKVCVLNDNLYFINDNQLCRFKNRGELTDYSDGSTIVNGAVTGGVPIIARWSTKSDDDGLPQYFKTMMKKGSMVTLAPYERSSVKAYARPDGYFAKDANGNPIARYYIGEFYADIWHSFEYIDFSRFTFDTRTAPRDIFFRKKKKKYVRLQLVFENDALNEGFGIHQVVKTITATRFAK